MGISLEQLKERLASTGKPVKLTGANDNCRGAYAAFVVSACTRGHFMGENACGEPDLLPNDNLAHYAFAEPEQETVRLWEMKEGVRYAQTGGDSVLFFVRDATHVRVYSHEKSSGTIIDDIYNYIDGTFTEIKPKKAKKTVEAWAVISSSNYVRVFKECPITLERGAELVKLTGEYTTYE